MPIPRAQSAMEYLVTYGWAIIVILVAFSVLYEVGVFSTFTTTGGALPGSCKVYRPYGPGTQQLVTEQGVCNNEQPKSVGQFSGGGSYDYAPIGIYFGGDNQLTASAWVYLTSSTSGPVFGVSDVPPCSGWDMPFLSAQGLTAYGYIWGQIGTYMPYTVPTSGWYNIAITYNPSGSGTGIFYVNGVQVGTESGQYGASGAVDYWTTCIYGSNPTTSTNLNGQIANIQAYNASLSANEIKQMYFEGVGGEPINLQNLVAWWPLNGDTLDYSGNGNNGAPSGMSFSGTWASTYTPP